MFIALIMSMCVEEKSRGGSECVVEFAIGTALSLGLLGDVMQQLEK